ncbi:MAG TPA: SPFH domain-containing protein [Steroidobacteraceae bacterium]|nr:SPFH domain-containing protein [Steroidobacteraceae bacterium]
MGDILANTSGVFIIVVLIFIAMGAFFTVDTAHTGIVQRLGKFSRIASPGLNFKIPLIDTVVKKISLQVQQLDVKVETKTKDNVFVIIPISVQYQVIPEKVYDAFYKLSDPIKQIESFVYNVILGHVPKMTLDQTFEQQAQIAIDVKDSLDESMREFGYSIAKSLITDIIPDDKVKSAMNDINAAAREREATVSRAETEKMLLVKKAEAEAESKKLQGEGIANQRTAIIEGLRESVERFSESVSGATAKDAMTMVLMTQYFDTLKEIAGGNRSNTIMMPHTPNALNDLFAQFRDAIITGSVAASPDQGSVKR